MRLKDIKLILIGILTISVTYFLISSFSGPRAYTTSDPNSSKMQFLRALESHPNWKETGLNFQPTKKLEVDDSSTPVRQQLAARFPYDPTQPFPKNIWQTWKVGIEDETFPKRYLKFQLSWDTKNPEYKHHVIPDDQCDELVAQLFEDVPDVARAYKVMPKSILKADFFRYLILFARGGVYTDIDTVGLKPIDTWMSNMELLWGEPNRAGLVVGIEADPDRPDWADWYARRIQFCQWTIQLKKGHPMLRELITKITDITLTREKRNELKKVLGKDEGGDIMNWTGPGIFTDTVFSYMNAILQAPEVITGKYKWDNIVDWKVFTGMQMPIAIDDVLVLPITSFSPDVSQMGSKSSTDPMAYAKHMFLGSWKDDGMPEME
ncbi:Initiation-specific alpha-1,6-mannosyltransferase [Candida viswanathii]|uniref:Initiation-specific alpha-1,6-mannosyltransferase n=1 Tax=Candida viswanathii TaxID=5486 RepID=A0A367XY60_9ASCO|nr:Initiation-specific alpha-1,6-mannosyltransferase [Candida viswanathii]